MEQSQWFVVEVEDFLNFSFTFFFLLVLSNDLQLYIKHFTILKRLQISTSFAVYRYKCFTKTVSKLAK